MNVHSLALQRAADVLGGKTKLRELLRVPMSELERWLAGAVAPPLGAFLKAVDVISAPANIAAEAALDAALRATGAERGNVQLLYPDGLRIVAQRGFERPFLDFFARVDDARSACGAAMKECRRVVVADVESDPIFAGAAAEVMEQARVRAVQSTPLVDGSGRLLGMLSTHRDTRGAPGAEELRAIDRIAARTARSLEAGAPS